MSGKEMSIPGTTPVGDGSLPVPSQSLSVAEVLRRAADLVEPAGAWTQGDYARNAGGDGCWPDDEGACCWCSIGAIQRVTDFDTDSSLDAQLALEEVVGEIPDWNDARGRTQAEVVAALRLAADLAAGSLQKPAQGNSGNENPLPTPLQGEQP